MSQDFNPLISPPVLSRASDRDLNLESVIQELPIYHFQREISCSGVELAHFLEKYPLLPGAILLEQGEFMGMISRRRLLEFLIRPRGQELFIQETLGVLYSYARTAILLLPGTTPILTAIQHTLRRSPELLAEPIVVQTAANTYQLLDIHDLNIAAWQIQGIKTQVRYERSQAQMIQNDKMARLGRLVDGVAHEILDPVGFIWGNLTYVSNYSQDLLKLIAEYDKELPQISQVINQLNEEIEFDFLAEDLSKVVTSIRTGAERLKKLVSGLQNFCYIDEIHPKPADLHACIDSIVLLMKSRLKGEIQIIKNYGNLPPIYCFMGQLNQVLMNILSQTIDVLLNESLRQKFYPESTNTAKKPRIEITTKVISLEPTQPDAPDSRWVSVCITDNGPGMSQELQQEIMESFSLEKWADKETSLAMSYRIIASRHGGKLNFSSQLGIGTEFEILLPLV
ncbi:MULTISPECIES: sensor histidine kinase [Cyanophyceae]|uniref:sensor histidine kinase n=1 Tax=Cyanophyceae TaxID=3028117 RepID=UPI00232B7941|nr:MULTISPECIES: HAMP domain-containing sensor histidine kinase [Cyanophyceae]MDB9338113.1 HAMP domain-containing sensor histidine kinase [Nodularia spumigena CS-589/07]MDB9400062.1 HAMP domain-containing sensor histidine kinase [Microcystis aeruginosa CS-567/02-A1]MDB9500259.1 HAMP domain-containing sensor histidine kinase [Nodularia spumigena CS-336/02]MDB9530241.1 HAMP domain-containing sensor histidine kinase [Nodularia spumigena CS-1038]